MENLNINTVLKHCLFIALSMILSISVFANERSNRLSLTALNSSTILLELPGNTESSFIVSLYDMGGKKIHQEVLAEGTEERSYNINKLSSGEYVFEISFNNTKKWKHIHIANGNLQTVDEDFQLFIEPTVVLNSGILDLNLLSFSDSEISLSIWDSDGNLLHQDYLAANGSIEKRYDLRSLKAGEYQLHLSSTEPSIDFDFSKSLEILNQKTKPAGSYQLANK